MNTISNGLKGCAKAIKYAYVIAGLNVNQQSKSKRIRQKYEHTRPNMDTCAQMQCVQQVRCAGKRDVFVKGSGQAQSRDAT